MFIELTKGVALLLALSLLQSFVLRHWRDNQMLGKIVSGLLFGGICVIGMEIPLEIAAGVIFDARSVILSMAGLFGGPVVGGIAAVIAGGFRAWIGGGGSGVGVAVVLLSVSLGLLFRYCRDRGWVRVGIVQLLAFGFIVHAVEILLFTQLPADVVAKVMGDVAGPLLLIFSPATALLGMLLQDIRQRMATEQALRESEQRFHAFATFTPNKLHIKDNKGRYILINPRCEYLFGVSNAQAMGKKSSEIFQNEMGKALDLHDEAVIKSGEPIEVEERFFVDDRVHSYLTVKFPILGASGDIVAVGSSGFDITEYKNLEDQLRQAQKMEVVGQLTGGVAHDFNNLLGVMIGNTEMLEDLIPEDHKARHNVEAIFKAVDRATSLTQRLLAFSRRQALSSQPTDLNGLIAGLLDMLKRTLGETIELRTQLAPDVHAVLIDSHQFENALVNLAINARDAMPIEGVLTIAAENVTLDDAFAARYKEVLPGDYVKVSVHDTGCGMADDVVQKVFEPFFTTKDVGKGSGLGLSMVYGFIKQSNGHVTVDSEPGVGTTVTIFLPQSEGTINDDAENA